MEKQVWWRGEWWASTGDTLAPHSPSSSALLPSSLSNLVTAAEASGIEIGRVMVVLGDCLHKPPEWPALIIIMYLLEIC